MNSKLLFIILGLLVGLFFLTTGLGLSTDDGSVGGLAETVVEMVRGLRADTEPLRSSDLAATTPSDCRNQLNQRQLTLMEGESCRFDIERTSDPVRTLKLCLRPGGEAEVSMRLDGEHGTELTQKLSTQDSKRELELQFPSSGGRLTVTCTTGNDRENRCVIDAC